MKKVICILLSVLLFICVGCKKKKNTSPLSKDEEISAQNDIDRVNNMFNSDEASPEQENNSGDIELHSTDATAAHASVFIGKNASIMEAQIGSPNSKSYTSSESENGVTGIWNYDGFTVYTKQIDANTEIVVSVS